MAAHNRCYHVYPFVRPVRAYSLGAKQPAVFAEQHFHMQDCRTGIISRMGFLADQNRIIILILYHSHCPQGFFISSRNSCRVVKYLGNGGSHCSMVFFPVAGQIVGADSGLSVGRPRKRYHGRRLQDKILDLNDISYRINVFIGSLQKPIRHNASPSVHLKSRSTCQSAVRLYPNGEQYHLCPDCPASGQVN